MRVKIGDTIHDSETEPIMVILSDIEKRHIESMPPGVNKYCSYPEGREEDEIKEFMRV